MLAETNPAANTANVLVTRSELAVRVNLSRQTLYDTLRRLREHGLVRPYYRGINIPDMKALRHFSAG